MTYFHTGCSTIIGAKSFHGPVRDGKGWYQLAMVIRHDLSVVCRAAGFSPGTRHIQPKGKKQSHCSRTWQGQCNDQCLVLQVVSIERHAPHSASMHHQGYRDKPHGQLVLVSLTHYCASTPSLSTSWSRTTLQGDQVSRESSSSGKFPA